MFDRLLHIVIDQRWPVMLATLAIAALGLFSFQRLPIDAVPDITNVQVQINTEAPGYSPLEAEQRITFPIETAMAGLPQLVETRSISRYGLSQVTVVFSEGTDLQLARQLVAQRVQEARSGLPAGLAPALGPIATGLGEVYMWTVEAVEGARKGDGTPWTLTDLREIQDWIVKPRLRTVPGVTEVNTVGGFVKEFQVAPLPDRLAAFGLGLADVVRALERNNANVGAGYVESRGAQLLVRAPGQLATLDEIREVVVGSASGQPIRVADVAEVGIGKQLRTGAASENGEEVVLGTVFMLIGENSRAVARAVDARLGEINRTLPKGVVAKTVYDRTILVDRAISTVRNNLVEGALLVVVVLFLFMGNLRAAIITALVIPLAMLFTFTGMVTNRISANLMSLGALDFGIIVDGAVVIVESCVRRLAHAQAVAGRALTREERLREVFLASSESRRALLYGQAIIIVVYLPLLALTGVEGRMFQPMAFTVVLALLGAMVLSITFVPAAVALFLAGRVREKESWPMARARRAFVPMLAWAMERKALVLTFATVAVVLSGLLATRMGSEFVPSLDEGDIALHAVRVPGTSLTQAVAMQARVERMVKAFPEVETVFSKIGTAEIATDPMPPNVADNFVMLKPRDRWPDPSRSKDDLVAALQSALVEVPGDSYEYTQPIQMRFNELISGVRTDVAVKVFGDEMAVLNDTATRIARVLEGVRGAADVRVEQTTGLPMLTLKVDREKAARLGIDAGDVQEAIGTAVGGREVGVIFEGDRRFDLLVRLPDRIRGDMEAVRQLPIPLHASNGEPDGARRTVRLGDLVTIDAAPGPNQVSRDDGKRRVVVTANVRGRDIGSFVSEAEARIDAAVPMPAGYWTTWGGTFEQLKSATERLQVLVPVALLSVFALLFMMFGNVKDGLIVFTGVPFALCGGIVALWARGIPLSISAAVGFIALCGVAVLNGLVLIATIRALREQGVELDRAIEDGVLSRLRPVLMTALVASLGFVPMAIATGTGAEVQRPLATVVIAGIVSSTALTLLVLPVLYRLVHGARAMVDPADRRVSTTTRATGASSL